MGGNKKERGRRYQVWVQFIKLYPKILVAEKKKKKTYSIKSSLEVGSQYKKGIKFREIIFMIL